MPTLPEPPAVEKLRDVPPELTTLSADQTLARIYRRGGDHPTEWDDFREYGPLNFRFDHHPGSTREHPSHAIFYAAASLTTTLAEVYQDTRIIHTRRGDPALVVFELARDLELLDLSGDWPDRSGATMAINSGPRPRARRWSRAIHRAYPDIDGLYYCSSMHANEPSVAIYERATDALPTRPQFDEVLHNPRLLDDLKRASGKIGYTLII